MALIRRIFSGTNWKHAAAELALIVIGVTIALWADAWVGDRQDSHRENARLDALFTDTEETLAAISAVRLEVSDAAVALRGILSLQPPYEPHDETLKLLRHGLLFGLAFHPEMSVYDDLKNSGELALLTNPVLRQALSSMEAGLEQLRMTQADLTTVQQLNVDSYMVDHMELISFYGELTGLQRVATGTEADLGFVGEREFRNRVLLKLDLVTQLESVLEEAESRVNEVKRRIAMETESR
ncbi:MAG: hypothetical protein QNI96_14900 [Woeseiaceae bacterium]|nr:hypothetical protein [Woeseiaceae bacterium]